MWDRHSLCIIIGRPSVNRSMSKYGRLSRCPENINDGPMCTIRRCSTYHNILLLHRWWLASFVLIAIDTASACTTRQRSASAVNCCTISDHVLTAFGIQFECFLEVRVIKVIRMHFSGIYIKFWSSYDTWKASSQILFLKIGKGFYRFKETDDPLPKSRKTGAKRSLRVKNGSFFPLSNRYRYWDKSWCSKMASVIFFAVKRF